MANKKLSQQQCDRITGPEVIKLFSCNSIEYEIYPAHKC